MHPTDGALLGIPEHLKCAVKRRTIRMIMQNRIINFTPSNFNNTLQHGLAYLYCRLPVRAVWI